MATGSRPLDELDLTDIATDTFLEVDIRAMDGTSGTLMLAHPAPIALLDSPDSERREEGADRQRCT